MIHKQGYITVNLKIKFILDFAPHYCFVLDGKCYNQRTGRFIKQIDNNGSICYIIDGHRWNVSDLRPHLKKPAQ